MPAPQGYDSASQQSAITALNYRGTEGIYQNAIINSNFDIWQRGTSFAGMTTDQYTADRWRFRASGATVSVTQQSFEPYGSDAIPQGMSHAKYYARYDCTSGDAGNTFDQKIENVRTFAGKKIHVSFWARINSGTSSNIRMFSEQNFGSGGSSSVYIINDYTPTSEWQKFTFALDIASIEGKTAGAGDHLRIAVINTDAANTFQIDIAQVSVRLAKKDYVYMPRTIQQELTACKRYYQKVTCPTYTYYTFFGFATATTKIRLSAPLGIELRTTPTMVLSLSNGTYGRMLNINTGATDAFTVAPTISNIGIMDNYVVFSLNDAGAPFTINNAYHMEMTADDYISFDAEL